jgi:peptidoglycan/LPS O-acetylase OafA/YrhL
LVAITGICGAWSGYYLSRPFNRTIGFLISPIAWSCVVLWLIVFRGSRITAFLRISPVRQLANISYGAYLLHLPIAQALGPVSRALGVRGLSSGYPRVAAVFSLTVIVSYLSWRFFESPVLRLKERLFPRQTSPADLTALGRKPAQIDSGVAALSGVQ